MNGEEKSAVDNPSMRAAAYIRMSTRAQALSPKLQEEFLNRYAAAHGMRIVRVYADEGCSGLHATGRPGFLQLLLDLDGSALDFSVLLVYDVSRWGRYQNVDAAGYYEFQCTLAGVRVLYCAEPFVNDGSPASQLMKSIKRSMAAETSRVLSVKVFAAQCRLARLGYKQGGAASYAMRRVAVAADGQVLRQLMPGERKPHARDHVRLVPGGEDELATVRRIFQLYNHAGWTMRDIARQLNAEAVPSGGKAWSDYRVKAVLGQPQYWGCQAYNRSSTRLRSRRVRNPESDWIFVEQALAPTIEVEEARLAQLIRRMRNGDEPAAVLQRLREVHARTGRISYSLLAQVPGMPGQRRLCRMFGSLATACAAAGIAQPHLHICRIGTGDLQALRDRLREQVLILIQRAGGHAERIPAVVNQLQLNNRYTLCLKVLSSRGTVARQRWRLQVDAGRASDFILAGLLDASNQHIERYALIETAKEVRKTIYFGSGRYAKSRGLLFPDLASVFGLVEGESA